MFNLSLCRALGLAGGGGTVLMASSMVGRASAMRASPLGSRASISNACLRGDAGSISLGI